MIIVRFKGGLGNQFFQYAAGRALAARHGVSLRFDARWYAVPEHHLTAVRTFDLPAFQVQGALATEAELAPFAFCEDRSPVARLRSRVVRLLHGRKVWHHDAMGWDPEFAQLGRQVLLDGYFQDPAYFAPVAGELRRAFSLRAAPPTEIATKAAELSALPSVCVQVRRTDLVADPERQRMHGTCSVAYYRAAWAEISRRVPGARGFVFTDDVAWARETFSDWRELTVMGREWDGPAFLHRLFLMQACRHFLIANSTWGWWAAWLGEKSDSTAVMPERWFADPVAHAAAQGLRQPHWLVCREN